MSLKNFNSIIFLTVGNNSELMVTQAGQLRGLFDQTKYLKHNQNTIDIQDRLENFNFREGLIYINNKSLRWTIYEFYRYNRKKRLIFTNAIDLCHIVNQYGLSL